MSLHPTRRHFLQSATTVGASVGVGGWSGLIAISPPRPQEAAVTPDLMRYSAEIEPIVRLIASTPRDRCVAVMMEQMRKGLPYRHFLAAFYLAASRAPTIHALHAILSVHSSHLLSLELPVQETLLPTFWALDNFKGRLDTYTLEGPAGLTVPKGPLPAAEKADDELGAGIEKKELERAQRALMALIRSRGAHQAVERLWYYGVRYWGFIGHSAIYVSNAWRLLQTVGWEHVEPVLCSAVAVMHHSGPEVESMADPGRIREWTGKLPADWARPGAHPGLTKDLLELMRKRRSTEACDLAVKSLVGGKATAGPMWDAILLGAGECVISGRGGNTPLHACTVANALRYAFEASGQAENRLLLLLQGLNWMERYRRGDGDKPRVITDLTPLEIPDTDGAAAAEILSGLHRGGHAGGQEAAGKTLGYARKFPDSDVLFRTAARLIPAKAGRDTHNVKFPVAMFENCRWVSPEWRPHLMAAASFSFLGADAPDSQVIQQVREAIQG